MRRPDRGARGQRRRVRVLQALPSRRDHTDENARVGARRDARMATAIWQATVVDGLVSDARWQTRRRSTRAIPSQRLACRFDRHRHLRVLVCGSHGRVRRRLTGSVCRGAIGRDARYLPIEVPRRLSQRNLAADRDAAVDGWHELSVANPTFLLERLGSECTDLQGLRELTVNGLDAIAALGDCGGGRVVWDLDWLRFDASGGRVRKLSVTDTGTGMTAEELRQYINQLASSGREQSASGNFGVGAKVAAGSRNPHGLEYRS